jgi:hypothetical protein
VYTQQGFCEEKENYYRLFGKEMPHVPIYFRLKKKKHLYPSPQMTKAPYLVNSLFFQEKNLDPMVLSQKKNQKPGPS